MLVIRILWTLSFGFVLRIYYRLSLYVFVIRIQQTVPLCVYSKNMLRNEGCPLIYRNHVLDPAAWQSGQMLFSCSWHIHPAATWPCQYSTHPRVNIFFWGGGGIIDGVKLALTPL